MKENLKNPFVKINPTLPRGIYNLVMGIEHLAVQSDAAWKHPEFVEKSARLWNWILKYRDILGAAKIALQKDGNLHSFNKEDFSALNDCLRDLDFLISIDPQNHVVKNGEREPIRLKPESRQILEPLGLT